MEAEFWDQRYKASEFVYGIEPNAFLAGILQGEPPGRLLLPAEGEGRNALYAARHGWQVDAVDYSAIGRDKALALARQAGVNIDYHLADLVAWQPSPETYDLVGLIYLHLPSALRCGVHRRLVSGLKTGGILVLEAFSQTQLGNSSGGPQDPDMLYTIEALREDFAEMGIRSLAETTITLDEGVGHQGRAHVIRMIAEKR
jgi:SAM-dependent methyltransferase